MRIVLLFASLSGAVAVALGAYSAHGMAEAFGAKEADLLSTAVRYQVWHTLALVGVAAVFSETRMAHARSWARRARAFSCGGFILGILLFCGSIAALAFGAPKVLGAVTPVGGVCFISGWLAFGLTVIAWRPADPN